MRLTAGVSYAFLAIGALAAFAYAVSDSALLKAVVVVGLAAASAAAVAVGITVYGPQQRRPWLVVLIVQATWSIAWVIWQWPIVTEGVYPGTDALVNLAFLAGNVLMVAVLGTLLMQQDRSTLTAIDVGILFAAIFVVAWAALLHRYLGHDELPELGRGFQVAYALADVALLAVLIRIVASARKASPSFVLLLASAAGLVVSDGTWNWSTQLGDYVPGSWADLGWLAFHVLAGAAALHPSMRTVFDPSPVAGRQGRSARLTMLGAAVVVPPIVLTNLTRLSDAPLQTIPTAAASVLLGLLVVLRMHLILRDEARLGAELAQRNERLLELDRMKDEFVASVSHELRTPLTSIRGYLELVLDGEAGELTADQAQFLGVVDRNAERLLRVVSDLLFVAQVDAGKLAIERSRVELQEIVRHAVDGSRPAAQAKNIDLRVDAQPLPTMHADAARLDQLLDNIVSNAIKFTPPGGSIVVRGASEGDTAVLEVSDTGPGISAEDQEHLFERFFRTSEATAQAVQGTGLGLSIAKAIAEAHGGTLAVESAPGKGTTFRVTLPLNDAGARSGATALAEA